MSKPRLLDLFCGAGGAARGYQLAGFEVVGVDIRPQPRYVGDHFCQADVMEVGLPALLRELGPFEAVHASPPCQRWTVAARLRDREYPDLIAPLRPLLEASRLPYVIENVPGAPLRHDLVLCGSMFGLECSEGVLYRHRIFETGGWPCLPFPPADCRHDGPAIGIFGHNVQLWNGGSRRHLGYAFGRALMGVEWMAWDEMNEAIPPAYTEWIGLHLPVLPGARRPAPPLDSR